jgi:hypothetical protein
MAPGHRQLTAKASTRLMDTLPIAKTISHQGKKRMKITRNKYIKKTDSLHLELFLPLGL